MISFAFKMRDEMIAVACPCRKQQNEGRRKWGADKPEKCFLSAILISNQNDNVGKE